MLCKAIACNFDYFILLIRSARFCKLKLRKDGLEEIY